MGAVVGVAHAYTRAEFMEAARTRWQDAFGQECGDLGNSFFSQILMMHCRKILSGFPPMIWPR